jgi:uncharacterized MAPEG superfamily protein
VLTLPLACIPLALVTVYLPRLGVLRAQTRHPDGWDNKHPRDQVATITGWPRRAHAAHMNGFEGFAPFAAAVLVAHVAGADAGWAAMSSVLFVIARALYVAFYIANLDKLRTLVWIVGFSATWALFALPLLH